MRAFVLVCVGGRGPVNLVLLGLLDTLKAGRPGVPDRLIDSAELYELANNLIEARSLVYRRMIFQIPRALQRHA